MTTYHIEIRYSENPLIENYRFSVQNPKVLRKENVSDKILGFSFPTEETMGIKQRCLDKTPLLLNPDPVYL